VAWGAGLDGNALGMLRIAKLNELVAILAGGHVPQREGRTDHVAALGRDRVYA
jgi:hypothetical protein